MNAKPTQTTVEMEPPALTLREATIASVFPVTPTRMNSAALSLTFARRNSPVDPTPSAEHSRMEDTSVNATLASHTTGSVDVHLFASLVARTEGIVQRRGFARVRLGSAETSAKETSMSVLKAPTVVSPMNGDIRNIDECTQPDSCPESMHCVNTEGSFYCSCSDPGGCEEDCEVEGQRYRNGATWPADEDPCRTCSCHWGVVTCEQRQCDCEALSIDGHAEDPCCVEECRGGCPHQVLNGTWFKHKERWVHQCQTCECFAGSVDCWEVECPPPASACGEGSPVVPECCPSCSRGSHGGGANSRLTCHCENCSDEDCVCKDDDPPSRMKCAFFRSFEGTCRTTSSGNFSTSEKDSSEETSPS
ncbi:unnamed protein product [Cyprideis torosa]|uniref:Uncharacterized protein n=1 Tax=Cyprideis torosa TaxID=163714 RepID=A0A7R8W4R4_9CRUS|nr:unnamed protein product [Cyprideis torosa]CAG0883450.1 unnamed protein product [Cyprideis torosa]